MFRCLLNLFRGIKTEKEIISSDMKYLIIGLGNIGPDYAHTRHNIGFDILDALAEEAKVEFEDKRYGFVARFKHKSRLFILLKPSTYVNLSGRAVNYWMQKEKIPLEKLLVVVDDLSLPFGKLRIKAGGSDAGHNGLKSIQSVLGHNRYARLRFGIGDNFSRGRQVDYVLGKWTASEKPELPALFENALQMIKSFATIGITRTMNEYNKR